MSIPNVVMPWSHNPVAFSADAVTPADAPTGPDAAPVAAALFNAGFVDSAFALVAANPDHEALCALADGWQATRTADAALATMIANGAGVVVPSVSVRDDGAPRFVVYIADSELATLALQQEHGEHGVDSELRLFLDEALRDGDRFIDAAPGDGFAALSAASHAAAVSVIALCSDAALRDALEASAQQSGVDTAITARTGTSLAQVPTAPASSGSTTMLHVGSAAAVAAMLSSVRGALERREIGVVAWRCGRADEVGRDAEALQIAAAVLGLFGFQHFALADGAQGTELVPAESMASNTMIFSLEPGYLTQFAA